MINEGFKNDTQVTMMNCDFLAKFLELKNYALKNSEMARDFWDEGDREAYESIGDDTIKKIEKLFDFLYTSCIIKDDVPVDAGRVNFGVADAEFFGLPMGFCNDTLETGISSIGFVVESSETYVSVYKLCYFDGKKFKIFTPYLGNPVNVITCTALGDELLVRNKLKRLACSKTAKQIFGNVDNDTLLGYLRDQEECGTRYLRHFDADQEFDKDTGWFEFTKVEPDFEFVADEIWDALKAA